MINFKKIDLNGFKPTKKIVIIGGSIAALAIAAIFLLKKKAAIAMATAPILLSTPTPAPAFPQQPVSSGAFSNYTVSTLVSDLNVRATPAITGEVVNELPNGTVVLARPSSTSGWYEYSLDGVTVAGYLSAAYLKQ